MSLPAQFDGIAQAALPRGPLHLAMGMFDGVHLGHRAVIEPAVRAASASHGIAAVLTFRPHPSALFRPADPTRLIQDPQSKARVLGELGVQAVITERFTPVFAQIEAEDFLPWLKRRLPALAAVYVGANFRFGRGRRGNVELLAETARPLGIGVASAPRLHVNGELASSTRIRAHLEAGEIEAANALLGYSYFSEGVVTSGKRMGRTIGFPTLNVPWSPDLRPKFGVYVVRVAGRGEMATPRAGVANYGVRPTVEAVHEPKLEIHVLGECPFGTGDWINVEWLRFIRPEARFANVDELRAQIARDVDTARKWLNTGGW